MNKIISFILILCILYIIFFDYEEWFLNEHFNDKEGIMFKKTLSYDLLYYNNTKKYSIWSPKIIDDYYPIGHIITRGKNPPNILSTLVKTNNSINKPQSFSPISLIIENGRQEGGFWKPIEKKGHVSLGHIYHKPLRPGLNPSIHRHIRCIPKKYLLPSTVNNIIVSENKKPGYQLWGIEGDNSFICNQKMNSAEPRDKIYKINPIYLTLQSKLRTKKTTSYKLIYSTFNKFTNKYATFWRPLPNGDYVSIGDIVLDKSPKSYNPNNKLETVLVHKIMTKPPLEFGIESISSFKKNRRVEASIWKVTPPEGYGNIGNIITLGSQEPLDNSVVNCIPLEYLKNSESKKKSMWNSLQIPNNKLSLWTDENNFFISSKNYSYHNDLDLEIDYNLVDYEKDILDKKTIITLNFVLNPKNTEIYNSNTRLILYKKTLCNRLGIKIYRLGYLKFFGRKVQIELMPRPAGSQEPMITNIIKNLKLLIKNNLTIINSKEDGFISTITSLNVEEEADDKSTRIDNTRFKNKIKKIY